MRLIDGARTADHHGEAALLKLASFGTTGDRAAVFVARQFFGDGVGSRIALAAEWGCIGRQYGTNGGAFSDLLHVGFELVAISLKTAQVIVHAFAGQHAHVPGKRAFARDDVDGRAAFYHADMNGGIRWHKTGTGVGSALTFVHHLLAGGKE